MKTGSKNKLLIIVLVLFLLTGCATDDIGSQPTQKENINVNAVQGVKYQEQSTIQTNIQNTIDATASNEEKLSNDKYYINVDGDKVHSPAYSNTIPSGASARCGDGTYSFSQNRRGTCSHHGGVAEWLY